MTGAARVLRGLQFLNLSIITHGWPEVEKRFERLAVYSFLLRSRFGQCIGMVGSEEFAGQIFDVLARRRGITAQLLTKNQFWEFWEQLQTFFDMVDKNADGQITEEELKEVRAAMDSSTRVASTSKSTILRSLDRFQTFVMWGFFRGQN
ncbi:hypothetical protein GUJ93_ZPchr0014g47518 [Zizania palustris]|uniref:EF-hand domain-containing protein n=1 Tax=Zizania palustris TaxID=103762 RepID=A0A8J5VUW0_ZIZPA|nr:hypothetical protein GUJ93_ZPchr0014g47518 [Zizania palustris]